MANPTAALQVWNAADYDWLTGVSGSPAYEVEQRFQAWLTAISSNSSVVAQAGALPQLMKGVANSTDPEYFGFTLKLPQMIGHDLYFGVFSISTTRMLGVASDMWSDDGSNGGYGNFGDPLPSFVTYAPQARWKDDHTMRTSTYDMAFLSAQDATDGQEFFSMSTYEDGTTSSAGSITWIVYRDQNGHWAIGWLDNVSDRWIGHGFDHDLQVAMSHVQAKEPQSDYLPERLVVFRNLSSVQTPPTDADQLYWYAANDKLINWNTGSNTQIGTYGLIDNTQEVYLKLALTSLWVRYNPTGQY